MIYFGACSIIMGAGFDQVQQDLRIYPNLVAHDCQVINDAEGGSSNLKIFTKAAKAIIDDKADIYVIQWSAVHRHWVYPAPDKGIYIGSPVGGTEHSDFIKNYQLLNHDYPNLMSVIDYTRILTDLAAAHHAIIVLVNGMLCWKKDWQDQYMRSLLDDLTVEQQQDFQQRFDNNFELMPLERWANIYMSIAEMKIDDAPLDDHPGPRTHQRIAELVTDTIDKLRDKNERL